MGDIQIRDTVTKLLTFSPVANYYKVCVSIVGLVCVRQGPEQQSVPDYKHTIQGKGDSNSHERSTFYDT